MTFDPMTDPEGVGSTTWDEIDAMIDAEGYRAGFVKVFLEVKGMRLDDVSDDAKSEARHVTMKNFAQHFGVAVSTFHRWCGEFGGEAFAPTPEKEKKAKEAKERSKVKTAEKDAAANRERIRDTIPENYVDFQNLLPIRNVDSRRWFTAVVALLESTDETWFDETATEFHEALENEVREALKLIERLRERLRAAAS